jgi:hypothetical protein
MRDLSFRAYCKKPTERTLSDASTSSVSQMLTLITAMQLMVLLDAPIDIRLDAIIDLIVLIGDGSAGNLKMW